MDRYASYEYIAVSIDDRVATLTLNRPEKLNACRVQDHAELIQILRDIQDDDDVAAAVVTGAGRAFSVGGDIELLEQVAVDDNVLHQLLHDAKAVIDAHEALDKPIIAAINGWAMGAGLAFALLCDMIYAERGVMMADGHIRAAIAAGDAGALIWPLTVGLTKSKRYLLTGDAIDADEAERIGLITEVVEPGTSLAIATAMARRLADGPQLAIRYTKRALNQWLRLGSVTAFDYSVALEMLTFRSADFRLAVENLKASKTPAIAPPAALSGATVPSSDAVAAMPPLPTEDPSSKFFWDGARQSQLMILRCQACGHFIHLPRPVCRYCLSGDLIAEQVSGNGWVYSYTVARQAFHPWFVDRLPYVIAVIELVEEPELRILSNVIGCSPEDVEIGVDVEVVFQPVTNEVTLPMFQLRRV